MQGQTTQKYGKAESNMVWDSTYIAQMLTDEEHNQS
jgi:hypothetical protein